MNERIKELVKQAGLEMCSCGCDMPTRQSAKFAELIVRECAEVAWLYTPDTEELEYSHLIKDKILERFGVEE